jgi:hypothetical protein
LRGLILIHRYLGIALGLLMVVWCLSGIVMMYMPYPYSSEAERIAHLPPIEWRSCCKLPDASWVGFDVEAVGTRTVLRVKGEHGGSQLFDLASGVAVTSVPEADAAIVASTFSRGHRPRLLEVIDHDQWTVQGAHGRDRPLFHYSLDDAAGTEIYVSSTSGKAVQLTNARERFWNWLGAVPHWIYFSSLRQHPAAWTQVVVWTSLLGTFLTLCGLYIGICHFKPRCGGRWITYRGFHYWHHVLGLWFGLLLLTWVFSGLVSMNPWGFLEGGAPTAQHYAIDPWALPTPAAGWTSIHAAPIEGRLFMIATGPGHSRVRLDSAGNPSPLTTADLASLTRTLSRGRGVRSAELIAVEDDYYFSHHRERVTLPAYRVILDDSEQTRYYLDPVSGEVLSMVDRDGRWYRWLHQALHRIDFSAAVRAGPTRDVFMLTALVGMALLSAFGTYLGLRRLIRASQFL